MTIFKNTKNLLSVYLVMRIIQAETSRIIEDDKTLLKECEFPIPLISHQTSAIIVDVQNSSRNTINNCIIKDSNVYQSVMIFKNQLPDFIVKDKLKKLMNKNPTIILVINTLDSEIFENGDLNFLYEFQRSLIYIIVTLQNYDSIKCDTGINKEINEKADEFLNNLWHQYRLIHVVVALPFVCPHSYFTYNNKRHTDNEIYDRTTQVVDVRTLIKLSRESTEVTKLLTEGYPLRIITFDRFPTWVSKECSGIRNYITAAHFNGTEEFCGMDVLTSFDIVKHLKFKLSFPIVQKDSQSYGYVKPDGTVTGSLGYLARNEADVSFNSRFLVSYDLDTELSYLHHISHESLCIMLKSPDLIPLWYFPINAYDGFLCFLIAMLLVTVGIVTWIIAKMSIYKKNLKLGNFILDSVTSGLFGFFCIEKSSNFFTLRGSCLLFSIILLAVYQGHINYVFTTQIRYPYVSTIEEVYNAEFVIYTSASLKYLLDPPPNERQRKLMTRVFEYKTQNSVDYNSFEYVIAYPETGTLERKTDVILETTKFYTDENGCPKLYVVNECLQSYYLAFIGRKDFPFLIEMRDLQQRLLEAGLPDKYYEWTKRTLLGLTEVISPNNFLSGVPRPTDKINIEDNCIAFCLLLVGYVLSTVIFIFEFMWPKKLIYKE